jgi:peptidoglycan-associated lipoprotein
MRKNVLLIIFSFLMVGLLQAQPLKSVPLDMMLETAEECLDNGDVYNALDWYTKAYKEEKSKELALNIAYLNYQLRDYKRSANWYKRVLRRDDDNIYIEDRLVYGLVLKAMDDYPGAIAELQRYLEFGEDEEAKAFAQLALDGIELSKETPDNIEVEMAIIDKKVNSGFSEFSPSEYKDGSLYFASFQRNDAITIDKKEDNQFAKIYVSTKGEKGYDKATELGQHINRENFHTGNVSFSADGRRMYFNRSMLEGNNLSDSKIFVSYKNDSGWSPATEVQGVNGEFIAKHPTAGELFGNEVLFFVSDMDGGNGGFDIYYATRLGDAEYSSPVNLGSGINSAGDEATPFYKDGTLYFSSDGFPSLGGLDIYSTSWDGTAWSEVTNMGYGYNSSNDDWYFSLDKDGKKGFLVSNRPDKEKRTLKSKTCCDDIYEFKIRDMVIDLLALVKDADGPLNGANVELFDETAQSSPTFKTNSLGNDFRFLLDSDRAYKAIVTKDSYYPDTIEFNTAGIIDDYTVRKTIILEPMPNEPEVEIVTINQPIRLNNIYYDFDDWKILPDAEKDLGYLTELMADYPDMVIELSSHTDARGVSTYNQKLSQRRAESAKTWLVENGVDEDRIKPVGYGESRLLNHCKNGVRCNDDEHRFNRRTEFKIIAGPESIEIRKEIIKGPPTKKN